MECCVADVVPLLGVMIIFCLCGVGDLDFMAVFMKSASADILVYFWHMICYVGDRRILF